MTDQLTFLDALVLVVAAAQRELSATADDAGVDPVHDQTKLAVDRCLQAIGDLSDGGTAFVFKGADHLGQVL